MKRRPKRRPNLCVEVHVRDWLGTVVLTRRFRVYVYGAQSCVTFATVSCNPIVRERPRRSRRRVKR